MTKAELQIANAKLLASIGGLNARISELEASLRDKHAHVQRLRILVGNRYTAKPAQGCTRMRTWREAADYAREHGGTVQAALV